MQKEVESLVPQEDECDDGIFLGDNPENPDDREEAMWHLTTRWGQVGPLINEV